MPYIRMFKHYIHVPYMLLGVLEALAYGLALYVAVFFIFFGDFALFQAHYDAVYASALTFSLTMLLSMTAMNVYQAKLEEGLTGMTLRSLVSVFLTLLALTVVYYLLQDVLWYLGNGVLSLAALLSIFLAGMLRSLFYFLVDDAVFKRRVLVIGAGKRAWGLEQDMNSPLDRVGFQLLGYVPVPGEQVIAPKDQLLDVGPSLSEFTQNHPVDEIVVALDDRRKRLPMDDLLECKLRGIRVIDSATFFEREARKVSLDMISPSWLIFSDGFAVSATGQTIKRGFDLLSSLLLLIISSPIMLFTALAIKIEDGWAAPIIYSQERVGLNGKTFKVMKFRSMRVDAEKDGKAVWAKKNDSRVTRVGEFIRKVRIDELPQVFNVLNGDMCFVGPRPERPQFVEELSKTIPFYDERHRVKPGITGWAQLCFAYADSEEDSKEKLRYDLYYIKNQSLLLDIIILMQTVEVILFKKGSR